MAITPSLFGVPQAVVAAGVIKYRKGGDAGEKKFKFFVV
jgi:hypothetical protein